MTIRLWNKALQKMEYSQESDEYVYMADTMIKDKHGKKIFKNDIVKIDGYGVRIIGFHHCAFTAEWITDRDYKVDLSFIVKRITDWNQNPFEVIGNTIQNSDLQSLLDSENYKRRKEK